MALEVVVVLWVVDLVYLAGCLVESLIGFEFLVWFFCWSGGLEFCVVEVCVFVFCGFLFLQYLGLLGCRLVFFYLWCQGLFLSLVRLFSFFDGLWRPFWKQGTLLVLGKARKEWKSLWEEVEMVYEVVLELGRSWLVDEVGYWAAPRWWQVCWVDVAVASCVLV